MEEKLQKLTKQQMFDLLNRLYNYANIGCPVTEIKDAFDRGYCAGYENVKLLMVGIFNEYLENE